MFERTPELAPDLTWMLQSGQASEAMIIEALVEEYSALLFRLALPLLDEREAAWLAVVDAIRAVVSNAHRYRSDRDVKLWLLTQALAVCRQKRAGLRVKRALQAVFTPGRFTPGRGLPLPASQQEADLWLAVDSLPQQQAQLLKLKLASRLSEGEIAALLGVSESAVHSRIEAAGRSLVNRLRREQPKSEHPDGQALENTLAEAFNRRWPAEDFNPEQLAALRLEVEGRSLGDRSRRPKGYLPAAQAIKRIALGSLAVLAIVLVGWLSLLAFPDEKQISLTARPRTVFRRVVATATAHPTGAPAPPPVQRIDPEEAPLVRIASLPEQGQVALDPLFLGLYQGNPPDPWANSGSILLARLLGYWGESDDPVQIISALQPNPGDSNVMPYELVDYVQANTGLNALFRMGGDFELLARLIDRGFPVLLQKGHTGPDIDGWIGQYVIASGYDQGERLAVRLVTSIPYDLVMTLPYTNLQQEWRAFNYNYLVIYPDDRQADVQTILGEHFEAAHNYVQAAVKATLDLNRTSGLDQFFAWFNLGTSRTYLEDYAGAAAAFDEGFGLYRRLGEAERPWRMLWYQSRPYWAYYYTGRYLDVVSLADLTLSSPGEPVIEESLYWRALARAALGDQPGAIADLEESLRLNPNFGPGSFQLQQLQEGG